MLKRANVSEAPGSGARLFLVGTLVLVLGATWASAASRVVGKVSDEVGQPLPGVALKLEPTEGGQPVLEARTRKKGEFFWAFVNEGRYRLRIEADGMRVASVDIEVRDKDGRSTFKQSGPLQPGSTLPEIELGDNDTVRYDVVLAKSAVSQAGAAAPLLGPDELVKLIQAGDNSKARQEIERGLEIAPDEPRLLYLKAFLEMQDDKDAEALATIEKVVASGQPLPGARMMKGDLLRKKGDDDGAMAEYRREAESVAETDVKRDAYIRLADVAQKKGLQDEAIADLKKVIELDPANSTAYTQLIDLYLRTGKHEEITSLLMAAPEDVKNDPSLHYNLGVVHWNRGEAQQAAESFGKALELNPQLAEAHRQLGYCYVKLGNREKAIQELELYLKKAPKASDASEVQGTLKQLKTAKS